MRNEKLTKPEKWILLAIPILFFFASLMHMLYDFSSQNMLIGIIAPVNESVWEHLKLLFFPLLFWWIMQYLFQRNRYNIPTPQWIVSAATSILLAPLIIIAFYYSYTGAFGIESLPLDIFSVLLALSISQLLALHIYRNSCPKKLTVKLLAFFVLVVLIAFVVFTFNPPHLPIFLDSVTGTYGIN